MTSTIDAVIICGSVPRPMHDGREVSLSSRHVRHTAKCKRGIAASADRGLHPEHTYAPKRLRGDPA